MRKEVGIFDHFVLTMDKLKDGGLLLVSGTIGNPMTIGWGTIGIVWRQPMFMVLVRPSRYSFQLMEEGGAFTVNVPQAGLKEQVTFCGTHSGRDINKAEQCGFTLQQGYTGVIPFIKECSLHYECKIVHKNKIRQDNLLPEIQKQFYADGDYHTLYYGKILGVYKEE
jgi:flavin reductase (DIM6/NTAB) family NADH-FMN oxidoreductase RutF